MGIWKAGEGKYSNKESKFAINFREDHPDLFTKLSDKGFLVPGKTLTDGGYVYSVKEITSKKTGKQFVLVERIKDTATGDPIIDSLPDNEEKEAHKAVQNSTNYSEGAKKGHEENVAMHKEHIEVMKALISEIIVLRESVNALIKRWDNSGESV